MSLKKLEKYLPIVLMAIVVMGMPLLTLARLDIPNPASGTLPEYSSSPAALITKIINILLTFAGLLAVLFVIIGGFQYIFSGANEEWAENGKKTLRNAIIGLVVIILSYVIVNVINSALSDYV
ncbi:MAG: hypothetical protein HYV13_01850 [Candidatus Doudnabacteria bacterium]|nr:hypothetical protein [Candidatus Doudnabacteria bacterium]